MIWKKITLGEAIRVKHGFAFKSQHFSDSGEHIVLTPGNFYEGGGFRLRPGKDRFYIGDIPEDYVLKEGDLIIAMTEQGPGLLGSSALIPEGGKYLHNQRLGLIQDLDSQTLDKKFLYYLFNTGAVRGQISGSATGTKVRHTAPERIYRVIAAVPADIIEQEKIGFILSAYDDLIENNRRRIQLLEEAARLLYREWFVHLRFPGHEHVAIKDGVPEGWEKKALGDVAPLNYGKALKQDDRVSGPFPVYGSSGIVGTHVKALVPGPTIIVGRKGNVGSIYWSSENCHPIDTVYYIDSSRCSFHLYYALQNMSFISTDVAVPGLNRNFAHSRSILIPEQKIYRLFEDTVAPMQLQIDLLRKENVALAKARDLLLPRLMNGEIAV
jgi:type I restriction enzyme S subunit